MSTVKDKKEKIVKAEKAEVTTGQPNNGGFVVSLEDVDIPRLNVIQKDC